MKCIHPSTGEIGAKEWEEACTTARNYKMGINHFDKSAHNKQRLKAGDTKIKAADKNLNNISRCNAISEKGNSKKLLIVDGNSVINKAFYGTPMLRAPDGRQTNAVYGTLRTLIAAVMARKPTHLLVAMDYPGKTFRHEIFPEYKANRKESPVELLQQMPLVKETMRKLHIPLIEIKGFEADDIIGTVAYKAVQENFVVEILTSDKDCLQLINEKITVLLHKGRFEECTPYTTPLITGFFHAWTVDLKALAGDPSDNIPGAPRVGNKTAISLLKQYGSLDEVLDNAKEIPGKIGQNIRENIETIRLSKKLATIEKNVPVEVNFKSLALPFGGQEKMEQASRYLAGLGIKVIKLDSLFSRLPPQNTPAAIATAPKGRVDIKFKGNHKTCGICGSQNVCNEFIELDDGRLFFGAKRFFACDKCAGLLHPSNYCKIPNPKATDPKSLKTSGSTPGLAL
jgi:5'-3' exonuclease